MACNCGVTVQLSCPRHGLMGEMSKERTPLKRAAPELLEALKTIMKRTSPKWVTINGINLEELIAKAEGRG